MVTPQTTPDPTLVYFNSGGSGARTRLIVLSQLAGAEMTTMVTKLITYVQKTWIDENQARFPREIWNRYDMDGPRTNNHLEGFHRGRPSEFPTLPWQVVRDGSDGRGGRGMSL